MQITDMILVDNGVITIAKSGKQISFEDYTELVRYAKADAVPLFGKTWLNYMPNEQVHKDVAAGIEAFTDRVPGYDNLIDMFGALRKRLDDPLYGLTGKDRAEKKKEVDRLLALDIFRSEATAAVTSLGHTWRGGWDQYLWVQGLIDLAKVLTEKTVIVTDLDDIRRELSLDQATDLTTAIGVAYRAAFLKMYP